MYRDAIDKTFFVLLVVTATFLSSDARFLEKCSDKFAFPPHLIGTNHSSSSDLEEHKNIYNPVDLGVDNLDGEAPMHIRQALANATTSDDPSVNQYAPGSGLPRLRRAIAKMYSSLIGRELNPDDNVLVTVGATEAVYSAIMGHTFQGDEWLIIEPAYNIYLPIIQQARGVPRFASLKVKEGDGVVSAEDWQLNRKEFESLLSTKTKGIILNNPVNPIGKVWTLDELQFIGRMARKYNSLIISDEAHEWATYKPHIRTASLPGLYERTITIGSASKTFSLAGWRIGWAFGPEGLLNHAKTVHSRAVSSVGVPQQEAIAYAFEEEIRNLGSADSYLESHRREVQQKRDLLTQALANSGLKPVLAQGGYCIFANWAPLRRALPGLGAALDFVRWLIEHVGVLGLPGSSYYGDEHRSIGEDYARFCYHKKRETLQEASRRLERLKRYLPV